MLLGAENPFTDLFAYPLELTQVPPWEPAPTFDNHWCRQSYTTVKLVCICYAVFTTQLCMFFKQIFSKWT